jgi:hypothetical protein
VLIAQLLFYMFANTPIVGWILMWSCIPLIIVFGISYHIFLILLVLVIFIHVQLGEFINRIL